MPLDENFPTYQFAIPDATNQPTITTVHFTISGAVPQHLYTLTRFLQPANSYSISLTDAPFPDITYGSLSLPLLPSTVNPNELQRPSSFTLQLYSPDSTVTITQKHTALTRNNFWEFTLPKSSFLPPTQSALDASYRPPVSETLTFRWRKEGINMLTRSQLKCSLVSGGDEPDTVLAMYSGVGDKNGKGGELVVYESNFRRVEMQDLKGLEMVLLLSSRVVADVWFSGSSAIFNTTQRVGTGMGGPAPPPPAYEPPAASSAGTFAERFNSQVYPPDKPKAAPVSPTTSPTQQSAPMQQPAPKPQPAEMPTPAPRQRPAARQPPTSPALTQRPAARHHPTARPHTTARPLRAQPASSQAPVEEKIVPTLEDLTARQRIADEQAEIRRMLADEERAAAHRQAAIDAETERLKRLYEQEALAEARARQQQGQQQQQVQRPHTQPGQAPMSPKAAAAAESTAA
ncbi:hypothetical protein BZA05DRAFT_468141 [Tricharina praecox]|uniref:uncharacterized protein n=1 Tax=Tricharina praecox TaxID=43433 RepID=UPI00221E8414|nr:uncharacterized protein BZA05DRAFT_468141 [Tricharina praecox]KAI5840361.1 hypothetical protein BZA05DRAFT_468141 [Tricharina praecox]